MNVFARAPRTRRRGGGPGRSIGAVSAILLAGWLACVPGRGLAEEGEIFVTCPATGVAPGASFEAEILVDAATRIVGSYDLSLIFDPSLVIITSVRGGTSVGFTGAPNSDPATYSSGMTALKGTNSVSTTAPSGLVSLARVTLRTQQMPGELAAVFVQIVSILAVDGFPLPSIAGACVVPILGPQAPTATPTATWTSTPTHTPTPVTTAPGASCVGDCNGDGSVTVDEILLGISIALGLRDIEDCPAFDRDGAGVVVVSDIVAAVNASLVGCLDPVSTPTTPIVAVPTPTASATPTAEANAAPILAAPRVYLAFPGFEIRYPIDARDPEGGALRYAATNLPTGATLDESTGVVSWIPTEAQVGPHYVPYTVADGAVPPANSSGLLYFQVEPRSPCLEIACDPATGCSAAPLPLGQSCCPVAPPARRAWIDAPCPAGGAVFAGRNVNSGIGRLQDCDWLRVMNFAQTGAAVRLNFEARCLDPRAGIRLRVRLQAPSRVVLDDDLDLTFFEGENGFIERVTVPFTVRGGGPFFDLEDAEAILTVVASDGFGRTLRSDRRVRLNFDPHPELDDPFVPAPVVPVP